VANPAIIISSVFPVAIHAPAHVEKGNPLNSVHGLNRTMAFLAGLSLGHVPFMGEMNKIRKIENLDPWDRFFSIPVSKHLFDLFRVFCPCYQLVAIITGLNRRDTGHNGAPGVQVAKLAWNFVVASMNFVAEINWLFWRISNSKRILVNGIGPNRYDRERDESADNNKDFFAHFFLSIKKVQKIYH
jgi:hypothetical protein